VSLAPLLIIAIGNPSRGDDALGPALLDALRAAGVENGGRVELLTDFQLQVEHALDLDGRAGVLFVDAAWPGAVAGAVAGATLFPIKADGAAPLGSHALRPQAVLQVCVKLGLAVPQAWLLAIEGQSFELGEPLSQAAVGRLADALTLVEGWLVSCAEPELAESESR
jgi:hydrogenase maturation protease